jgi:DNA processing protein
MLREAPAPVLGGAAEPSVPADTSASSSPDIPGPLAEGERARVLAALGPAPVDIDELARATGLSTRTMRIALLELSLAGRIEHHGHQLVSLRD